MKIDDTDMFTEEELEEFAEVFGEVNDWEEEESVLTFVQTYVNESNINDDYLNPRLRNKLANKLNRTEKDLEQEGLGFFQEEFLNLRTAINEAKSSCKWSSVIDICDSLIVFFNVRTYWEELEETLKVALEAAQKSKDQRAEARILNHLGHTFRLLGRAKDGIKYGTNSRNIFHALNEQQGEAQALYTLGYLYRSVGEWNKSIEAFEGCLTLFRRFGDCVGEAEALDGLGQVYTKQDDLDKAEKVLQESLKIKEKEVRDQFQLSITLNNLGKVYKEKGNLQKAKALFERSLNIKQEIGDRQGQGVSYNELGEIYRLMKDFDKALEHYDKSLDIKKKISASEYSKISDNHGEGLTLMNMGVLYMEKEEKEKAIIHWQNALEKLNKYSPEYDKVNEWLKPLYKEDE